MFSLHLSFQVAAAAGDENKQKKVQDTSVNVHVGVNQKGQVGDTVIIPDTGGVYDQVSGGVNVQVGGGVDTDGVNVQDADSENIQGAGALDGQGSSGLNSGGDRVQADDGVDIQDTARVMKWRKSNDKKIRFSRIKGRYFLRKKREATEKEMADDERAASGDDGDIVGEKLPEPEGLAWIDPMRLASQGVRVESVPSLANLLGLQVLKFRTPQSPLHRPYRPPQAPRRSPSVNHQLPGKPTPKSFSRFDNGIHPFGNSFHDSFDRYYKTFRRKDLRDPPGGSSYGRPPTKFSSYSDPSHAPSPGLRLQSGGGRLHQPPANTFPRPLYPSFSDTAGSLLQLLDPFNLFGHNQFPQLPRYPLPPPSYYSHQKQYFEHSKQTEPYEAEVKNIHDLDTKYEMIVDPNQEAHKGYQFKEDFPLRDDLYIGQDGNIYIKDESVISTNVPQQKDHGGDGRPSYNPPLQGPDSRPQRPQLTHSTPQPKGQFEEEDIGNFDYDFGDDDEEDFNYAQLLKNHNMDEHSSNDDETPNQDTLPHKYRNSPHMPQRPPTRFDENFLNHDLSPSVAHNPNFVHNPTNSLLNLGFFRWLFPSYGRTTHSNYFYNPREVLLPRFQYPVGPWSGQGVPLRTGTQLSGTNYKQVPPLPSHPRVPVHNPSLLKPPVHGLSPSRLPPYNPSLRPSLHNPSLDRPSVRRPPGSRVNTQNHNIVGDTKSHSMTRMKDVPGRGSGFYPGNGFFDSDFPTLFHMSPSQRNRAIAQLPRPMAQNATAPTDQQ